MDLDVRVSGVFTDYLFRFLILGTKYPSRFTVKGSEWPYSCLVRGALSQVTSVSCPASFVWTPACCMLPLGVDSPFSFTSLQQGHTQRFELQWWQFSVIYCMSQCFVQRVQRDRTKKHHLPVSGPVSFFNPLEARNFLSKEFHSNEHEQTAAISVAAGGVYH